MAGFGGGSSYLAVMVLAGLPFQSIRSTALLCNLVVTFFGFWNFARAGYFRFGKIFPFVILSIPMAYWGGRLEIGEKLFSILLGCSLLAVAVRLFLPNEVFHETKEIPTIDAWRLGLPVGGLLGFLSGLAGIGGGIFLSPLLILMRWVNTKEAAAAASFFILVNSFSGLAGQLSHTSLDGNLILPLSAAVFCGGQLGSRWSAHRLPPAAIRRLTAFFVLIVSVKLLWGTL